MLRNTRSKLVSSLVAALALSALVFAAGAGAQRGGAARQANQNASGGQGKKVVVGRGSETSKGSRVTITADDSLKDYRAYRSGDRFYVVLPKAAAGAGMRGSGKGYTDMQVEQRGDSVVVSYRVQPGAKSRVEQRFNRLEVVFDVPEGGGQQQQNQTAGTGAAGRTQPQPPAENRDQTPPAQQQNQTATATPAPSPNAAAERARVAAEEAARAREANAANAANTATPPPALTAEPQTATDPNAQPGATPAGAPTQEAAPAAVPSAEPQLAQAQPPAAPVSITRPAAGEPTGSTLGTFLLRNWALTLILALVVVGLGLIFAARRTSGATAPPVERADADGGAAAADEPRTARVREASAAALTGATAAAQAAKLRASAPAVSKPEVSTTVAPTPAADAETDADVQPLTAATALAGGAATSRPRKLSRKEARRKKKDKGARAEGPAAEEIEDEETLAAAPLAQEPAVEETFVAAPAGEDAVVEESAVEASAVEEQAVEELTVEEAAVEFEAVAPAWQSEAGEVAEPEQAAEAPVYEESPAEEVSRFDEAAEAEEVTGFLAPPPVEEVKYPEAAAETPYGFAVDYDAAEEAAAAEAGHAEAEAAHAVTEIAPVVPEAFEPEAAAPEVYEPEAAVYETAEAEAPASSVGIEPAFAPDPERVQAETRQLLEGEDYDLGVLSTRDPVARQMIAAELLSALAGRNPQRRERAGAAYVEQGFYDEAAHDLRSADAPAERAAAARSLALLGDRAATSLLVEALEDPNLDVRRAAVEALGALRDPAAVEPLEALLERERTERHRIPPRVIRVAADSCRDAAAELAAELAAVAAPEPAAEVEPVAAPFEAEPAAESAVEPWAEAADETVAAQPAEYAEESPVTLEPFVGEDELEPAPQAAAEDENAVLDWRHTAGPAYYEGEQAGWEESALAEAPAAGAELDPLVADLSEELNAAAETQSFGSAVAEPQAVAETGVAPYAETEEYANEVPGLVSAPAEDTALEPYRDYDDEGVSIQTPEPVGEYGRPAPFDRGAAEEGARDIAPFQPGEPATAAGDAAAGEWVDFDMTELREEPQPAASYDTAYEAAPPPAQEYAFESSSGETLTSYAGTAAGGAAVEDAPSYADAGAGASRDVEAYGAAGYESEEAAPAATFEKGLAPFDEHSTVPASIQQRLASRDPGERATAIVELSHVDTDEAFQQICAGFDDPSKDVRSAAARALYELRGDRAESFTRALREADSERRRGIGAAIHSSGLAAESISQLTGESREKTYEAFSLLFLMAKAGEVAPLVRAIEGHPSNEVRLAVVKLLALSGQKEILPAFRRLAVRGSLPTEVRSAVMEAIYQISSSQPTPA
ncbi:MAG TPA: HEAT repeat domain-containing protein [Pyrinomonadaceae bacterium]|jgi:HEAT repeat protein